MNIRVSLRERSPFADASSSSRHVIVTPGDVVCPAAGYIRGHGTFIKEGNLIASVAGLVERVNKLITVRPLKSRYLGEVGDVIVGRVVELAPKRWIVDVGGLQHAVLQLSAVTLPNAQQRKRTQEDQLQMREHFSERDLLTAEVHELHRDGSVALHMRSLKYGKLENGQFVAVPPALIRRLKQHFVTLSCGIEAILGNNGHIWLTVAAPQDPMQQDQGEAAPLAEVLMRRRKLHAEKQIMPEERERICRVHNAITVLAILYLPVHPGSIMAIYDKSSRDSLPAKDVLHSEHLVGFAEAVAAAAVGAAAEVGP